MTTPHPATREARPRSGGKTLVAVLAGLALIVVSTNTVSSLAQPLIGSEFGVGPADTGWIVFGYSMTFAVATALFGSIGARAGVTRSLVLGVLLLSVGSLVAATAQDMPTLIGSRLVQGLGGGAVPTLATALISERFDGPARGRALGVFIGAVAAGQAVGPVIGGLLMELAGWRAAVSIGIACVPAALVLAVSQRRHPGAKDAHRRVDLVGGALVALFALAASFTFNRVPVLGIVPGTSLAFAVVIASGAALGVRTARMPDSILPRRIVGARELRRVVGLGAIGWSAFLGTVVLVPIAASAAFELGGIALGLVLLPMALAAAMAAPNAMRVQRLLGKRGVTALALGALAMGATLLAFLALPAGPIGMASILALVGLGYGLLSPPLLDELSHRFHGGDRTAAIGTYYLCFFMGGGLGAAAASAMIHRGIELPIGLLEASPVPGFATAELLLAALPAAASIGLLLRSASSRRSLR